MKHTKDRLTLTEDELKQTKFEQENLEKAIDDHKTISNNNLKYLINVDRNVRSSNVIVFGMPEDEALQMGDIQAVTFLCIFVQGRLQRTQSQLIQIYSVDWTYVYDTYTIEHRTEPVSH